MGIIAGVCTLVGGWVLIKNLVVPVIQGTVDGVKQARKELKEEKMKTSSETES